MKRAGGDVEWPSGSSSVAVSVSPAVSFGSRFSSASSAGVVAAFLVGEQEAAERDHRAGGRELGGAPVGGVGGDAHDTVWPSASAIWEATVRFQIRS